MYSLFVQYNVYTYHYCKFVILKVKCYISLVVRFKQNKLDLNVNIY